MFGLHFKVDVFPQCGLNCERADLSLPTTARQCISLGCFWDGPCSLEESPSLSLLELWSDICIISWSICIRPPAGFTCCRPLPSCQFPFLFSFFCEIPGTGWLHDLLFSFFPGVSTFRMRGLGSRASRPPTYPEDQDQTPPPRNKGDTPGVRVTDSGSNDLRKT